MFSYNLLNYKPKEDQKEDTMRRRIIIILIVALFIAPNILWAQKDTKMMQIWRCKAI